MEAFKIYKIGGFMSVQKKLLDRLEYYIAGFYFPDIDTKELCEDFEHHCPEEIATRVKSEAEDLGHFINQLKSEGLI